MFVVGCWSANQITLSKKVFPNIKKIVMFAFGCSSAHQRIVSDIPGVTNIEKMLMFVLVVILNIKKHYPNKLSRILGR